MAIPQSQPLPSKLDGFNRNQQAGPKPASSDAVPTPTPAPRPTAVLAQSHDPRTLVANKADELLHTGAILGTATWAIWIVLSMVSLMLPPPISLLFGVFLNLMLFRPKLVYKLTSWLLLLVPFVDVAVEAVKKSGLDKVDIRINGIQKGLIYVYDVLAGMMVVMYIITVLIASCYITSGVTGQIAGKAADIMSGDNTYSSIQAFCKQYNL